MLRSFSAGVGTTCVCTWTSNGRRSARRSRRASSCVAIWPATTLRRTRVAIGRIACETQRSAVWRSDRRPSATFLLVDAKPRRRASYWRPPVKRHRIRRSVPLRRQMYVTRVGWVGGPKYDFYVYDIWTAPIHACWYVKSSRTMTTRPDYCVQNQNSLKCFILFISTLKTNNNESLNFWQMYVTRIGNESVPKIKINDTIIFFLNCKQHFVNFKP